MNTIDTRIDDRVVISTFADERCPIFRKTIEFYGGRVRPLPLLDLALADDLRDFDSCARKLGSFDLVIFSSPNAVRFFFIRLAQLGLGLSALDDCRIASIGSETTKALNKRGVAVDVSPQSYTAQNLIDMLKKVNKRWKVLIPCGNRSVWLKETRLKDTKFRLFRPVLYINRMKPAAQSSATTVLDQPFDGIVFTSPSGVEYLVDLYGRDPLSRLLAQKTVASIGPTTSAACRSHGIEVQLEPRRHTIVALMWSLIYHFGANQRA